MESLKELLPRDAAIVDLSIVRGLDYYTGTVYETVFTDDPGYGSICSGGRYDDLASQYINKSLPGVGISIGFTRLFARQLEHGKLPVHAKSPADVLMVLPNTDNENYITAQKAAQQLRANGNKVELYHAPQKLKKQLAYAEKKGINYVWFPPFEPGQSHEVKNMATAEQVEADPENWRIG
jgi:histidyl-tRNA synthetase